MIKNMLQAASKMLDSSTKEHGSKFKARVQCAKTIIDEIVAGMEPETVVVTNGVDKVRKWEPKAQPEPRTPQEDQYQVIVEHGKLVEVKGLDREAWMEIDGKKVQLKDAIGRPFQSGKIL